MSEERLSGAISKIVAAMSTCTLYSPEHPTVEELLSKALGILEPLYAEDALNITVLGDTLIFNGAPVATCASHIWSFMKKLRSKGIDRVIIRRGAQTAELKSFVSALALRGEVPSSSPHISVGKVEVMFKADAEVRELINSGLIKVNEAYEGISRFRRLDIHSLDEAVIGFISALKRDADVIKAIVPVKAHSEYTYVHETNVAVLTIFQAEALGLEGEGLHEAGLAGLLHDVGKMFIPKEIIEKKEKLDEKEWKTMQMHPVYGAIYLSGLPEVPEISVIAAYEHHMMYDGSGYPETKRRGKKQHIMSQMVSISDFFDALRTKRSYRGSLSVHTIAGLFNETSGRGFNPMLVQNFLEALKGIKAF